MPRTDPLVERSLLRMTSLGLVGPRERDAAGVVAHLACLQAQDFAGGLLSVALRSADGTIEAVRQAMNEGQVIRSWPMRGTLHLLEPADLRWMLALTEPRMAVKRAPRRAQLGIDDDMVVRAVALAEEAFLDAPGGLSRAQILAAFQPLGVAEVPGRGYHLINDLASRAYWCQGPVAGNEPLYVRCADWIGHERNLAGDEARSHWALRFYRSHGPATPADFARWTGASMGEARRATEAVRAELASITFDGTEHLMDPATPDRLAAHRSEAQAVQLLPGFDELVLGYKDRRGTVADEDAARIVPGNNGVFKHTVLHRGRVVATWQRKRLARGDRLDVTPFAPLSATVTRAADRRFAALPS